MATRTPTLGEVAYRNLREREGYGTMRAMKLAADACTTVACLAIAAAHSENGFPTQANYAHYWKQSERTAQREWALVKKAFPGEDGPERLARLVVSEYAARLAKSEDPSIAFSLPASVLSG